MSRRAQENLVAAILLLLFTAVLIMSFDYGPRARMVPVPIATRDGRLFADGLTVMKFMPGGPPQDVADWRRVAETCRELHRLTQEVADAYAAPGRLSKAGAEPEPEPEPAAEGETEAEETAAAPVALDGAITRPSQLLEAVLASGRKGLSISRYKGLGEMNAEQLWETTLDPENRVLLQVKVEDADVTDEIFTRLMGDVVEPRRDFIQENALNVANLDV